MKKLFVLAIAMVLAFSINAQKIGVKAGYGMSGYLVNFHVPDEAKLGMGYNFGLVAELDLEVLALRADVTYQQMGSDYYESADGFTTDMKTDINYLNIGVSVKKGFGPAYVFVGPYFGYALSGKTKVTAEGGGVTVDLEGDPFGDFSLDNLFGEGDLINKIDFGANLGVGASFSGVFVEANIGYGFLNYINLDSEFYPGPDTYPSNEAGDPISGDAKQNNIFFGLSVGYMFGF